MKQWVFQVAVATRGKGLYEFTGEVERRLRETGVRTGLVSLHIRHTSASLVIQENADPNVVRDLDDFFGRIAPDDTRLYRHTIEGADDMPAHIRAALTQSGLSIPVIDGDLALGAWQGIHVFEHRASAHRRVVAMHVLGE